MIRRAVRRRTAIFHIALICRARVELIYVAALFTFFRYFAYACFFARCRQVTFFRFFFAIISLICRATTTSAYRTAMPGVTLLFVTSPVSRCARPIYCCRHIAPQMLIFAMLFTRYALSPALPRYYFDALRCSSFYRSLMIASASLRFELSLLSPSYWPFSLIITRVPHTPRLPPSPSLFMPLMMFSC